MSAPAELHEYLHNGACEPAGRSGQFPSSHATRGMPMKKMSQWVILQAQKIVHLAHFCSCTDEGHSWKSAPEMGSMNDQL